VSDCERFCEAAGIDETLVAAGMRLSRSFALPALPPARKPVRLDGRPSAGRVFMQSARVNQNACARHSILTKNYRTISATTRGGTTPVNRSSSPARSHDSS
jgi:hypothetical protein